MTAAVSGGATGRVTFYDGVAVLGTGVISGGQAILKATFSLAGGHSLRARYDSDATHAAASSAVFTQTVQPSSLIGFAVPAVAGAAGVNGSFLAQGDFNGDGITDLATAGSGAVNVLLGNGDGTFH